MSLYSGHVYGQHKHINQETLYWTRFDLRMNFSKGWGLRTEAEIRRYAFPDRSHQLLIPRMTLLRNLPYGLQVGLGFTYFIQSLPQNADDVELNRPELRPHQELTMKQKWGNTVAVSHRYRLEERFKHKSIGYDLADGYDFNFRMRYRLQFGVALNNKKGAGKSTLKLSDELMVNFGENIVRNTFDQNRIYVGLSTKLGARSDMETGVLNWFQQKTNGDDFVSRYILRITYTHFLLDK